MEERTEWTRLCRVCGEEGEELVPIFSEQGAELGLQDKIHSHLPIQVSEDDLLPLNVCAACSSKLEVCHRLVSSCYEANTKLLSLLGYAGFSFENKEYCFSAVKPGSNLDHHSQPAYVESNKKNSEEVQTYDNDDTVTQTIDQTENIIISDVKGSLDVQKLFPDLNNDSIKSKQSEMESSGNRDADGSGQEQQAQPPRNKMKNETKFKVIVVKLKNSQRLPHDKQVSKVLQLLEQKKDTGCLGEKTAVVDLQNRPEALPLPLYSTDNDSLETAADVAANLHTDLPCTSQSEKIYVCMYCKRDMSGRENLILHHITAHPTKVFYCSVCDVICQSKESFNKHLTRHKVVGDNLPLAPGPGSAASADEQSVEISNIVNVNIDKNNPSGRMKVSEEFKDMNSFLKSQIVDTIKKIVAIDNKPAVKKCVRGRKKNRGLRCMVCQHISPTKEEYMLHKKTHPPPTFECKVCNKQCKTKVRLILHERIHTEEKRYMCEYCGKCFRYQYALKDHSYTHGVYGKPFKCTQCDSAYTSRGSLAIHIKSHSNEFPYLCDMCGKRVKHISNFRAHCKLHLDPEFRTRYTCDTCGKQFYVRHRLVEHKRLHTNELPLQCATCGKRFRTRRKLAQHNQIHINARLYSCGICGKRFNRRGNMITHMKRHDEHTCKVCFLVFSAVSDLELHLKSHNPEEIEAKAVKNTPLNEKSTSDTTSFMCNICNKNLSSKVTLNQHMRIHSGDKPYACEVCSKKFTVKSLLTYHLLTTHSGEKPFVCRFCQKDCLTKQSLIIHERRHTGEKPFTCEECGKAFCSKVNLNQHLIVHSDERPFRCPHCEKRFRRRDALDTHLRIHTGERPYPCRICGRRFRQKGDCNKHERAHSKANKVKQEVKLESVVFQYQEIHKK